jgi:hypothetical protein
MENIHVLPTDRPKQETLEEAAHEYFKRGQLGLEKAADTETAFLKGVKWQAERMYSEEDMRNCWKASYKESFNKWVINKSKTTFKKWLEQYKKK